MLRYIKAILLLLVSFPILLFAQFSSERVSISETFSANGKFKLRSTSYDNEYPNLFGESVVESTNTKKTYYKLNRSFDLVDGDAFFLALSNDGRKILYLIDRNYYKGEEHREATYYVDGKLSKTYTAESFNNCNQQAEKCGMFYPKNYKLYQQSGATTKQFKEGVSQKEFFLEKHAVFNKNDTVYVIDTRKKVTIYDVNKGELIATNLEFDVVYPKIKNIEPVKSRISYYRYPFKYISDLEETENGRKVASGIGHLCNLKFISVQDPTFHKFSHYRINVAGYIHRNGHFKIESLQVDKALDSMKIRSYLEKTTFKTDFMPREVDQLYLQHFFGGYRSADDKTAEEHTIKEKELARIEAQKRLTMERIGEYYIPKNLQECMLELDKVLNFDSKQQLREVKEEWQFNGHTGGLGMWIRNNWGLHGGSRIQVYFRKRNIGMKAFGADEISGTIIGQYKKWLAGDTEAWKEWEKSNPVQTEKP